jgi:hypothetical protein
MPHEFQNRDRVKKKNRGGRLPKFCERERFQALVYAHFLAIALSLNLKAIEQYPYFDNLQLT